jgi:hypothetical protein
VEDRDLGRRLAHLGNIAYSTEVVARIRIGEVGSTTDWGRLAEDDRWGREKALIRPNSLARLRASAKSSYWRGRVCRAYFASSIWNLKRFNMLMAISRGMAGLVLAGDHVIKPNFWLGMREKIE